MDFIEPFLNKRIELLNKIEPKDAVHDAIFGLKVWNNEVHDFEIIMVPYEGLKSITDRSTAAELLFNKIKDQSFFDENNIDITAFNFILFCSFDIINYVESCYVFNLEDNSILLRTYNISGELLLTSNLENDYGVSNEENFSNTPYCTIFDTETTGLPYDYNAPLSDLSNWPRLVQIAWLCFDENGNEIQSKNFIIRPDGFEIPEESSDVHGITTERASEVGSDIIDVLEEFHDTVKKSELIVAHNISFDEKIIGSEMYRNGMDNYQILLSKNKICTMKGTTHFCKIDGPYGYKWPKLSELHFKLFGAHFDEAHNALIDVKATANCFWELKKLGVL